MRASSLQEEAVSDHRVWGRLPQRHKATGVGNGAPTAMIQTRESRPSTANTMLLVLKPRPDEFAPNPTVFAGSENEREAWRKNRVVQMKLGAYLAEVHLQQRNSARLLKTEEYRFLQEAMRRSGVPRSVNMLDELHFYRDKTFPGRRFSHDWHFRENRLPHHKHPALSARPIRPRRQPALLNRPKTSTTLYIKNLHEEPLKTNNDENARTACVGETRLDSKYEILIDQSGRHVASLVNEEKESLIPLYPVGNEYDLKQSTELPPLKIRENKENVLPLAVTRDNTNNLSTDILTSTPRRSDLDKELTRLSQQSICRPNRVEPLHPQLPRQRKDSLTGTRAIPANKNILSRADSMMDSLPLSEPDKDINNNPLRQTYPGSMLTDEDIEKEINSNSMTDNSERPADHVFERQAVQGIQWDQNHHHQQQQQQYHQEPEDSVEQVPDTTYSQGIPPVPIDIHTPTDYVDSPETINPQSSQETAPAKPQKRLIRQNTRTNFNRVKNEPLMPLRHNITSVLRQERTRYEASQKKVKDYLHTMTSRDTFSRLSTGASREQSAQSRRSAGRRDEPKQDSKLSKKT